MGNWLSDLGRRGALLLVTATPALAQVTDYARIESMATVGSWSECDRYGDVRLVAVQAGFETVTTAVSVEWTTVDPDTGEGLLVATAPLVDCAGRPVAGPGATVAPQAGLDAPIAVALEGGAVASIGAPGRIDLEGC